VIIRAVCHLAGEFSAAFLLVSFGSRGLAFVRDRAASSRPCRTDPNVYSCRNNSEPVQVHGCALASVLCFPFMRPNADGPLLARCILSLAFFHVQRILYTTLRQPACVRLSCGHPLGHRRLRLVQHGRHVAHNLRQPARLHVGRRMPGPLSCARARQAKSKRQSFNACELQQAFSSSLRLDSLQLFINSEDWDRSLKCAFYIVQSNFALSPLPQQWSLRAQRMWLWGALSFGLGYPIFLLVQYELLLDHLLDLLCAMRPSSPRFNRMVSIFL